MYRLLKVIAREAEQANRHTHTQYPTNTKNNKYTKNNYEV